LTLTPTTVTFLFAGATKRQFVTMVQGERSATHLTGHQLGRRPTRDTCKQLYVDILSRAPDAGALAIINALNASSPHTRWSRHGRHYVHRGAGRG